MSKFQDFQGPLQKFQAWNPNFLIPGLQGPVRTLTMNQTTKVKYKLGRD